MVALLLIFGKNRLDEGKSEIRSSSILLITVPPTADREWPAKTPPSLEPGQEGLNSTLQWAIAFSDVVAGNFATGESVPPVVTLQVSCLAGASSATQKSQHSKPRAISKALGRQIFSTPVFLRVSESVQRRELLGSPKTQN